MVDERLDKPTNFNDAVQNRVIRHTLFLESLKTRQTKEILKFLDDDVIPDLIDQLTTRLAKIEKFGFDRGKETTQRIEAMIKELSAVTSSFKTIYGRTQAELFNLAKDEVEWQKEVMNEIADIDLNLQTLAAEQLRQVVFAKPFDGRTVAQWYDRLEESAQERLSQEIRRGVTEGLTTPQIVSRIQNEGYLTTTRKQTEAVVRSATSHIANAAREALFEANADIMNGVQFVATLDSRTCLRCSPLDGKVFELGKGVRPPLHTNCRCTVTPVTKSYKELGIDAEDVPVGTRASMNGQIAGDITYNQWLKAQPLEVQELALGKAKAQLFRNGNLNIDQFVNRNRVEFTLEDLKKREAGAFKKAGLQ